MDAPGAAERLDEGAVRLLRRAGWLGRTTPQSPSFVSFHSLFAALAFGDDELASWMRRTAEGRLDWGKFLDTWRTQPGAPSPLSLDTLTAATRVKDTELGTAIPGGGGSDQAVLAEANRIAGVLGEAKTTIWHVLAAYLAGDVGHQDHMAAWGFERSWWWGRFLIRKTQLDPARLPRWVTVGKRFERVSPRVEAVLAIAPRIVAAGGSEQMLAAILLDGKGRTSDNVYTGAWLARRESRLIEKYQLANDPKPSIDGERDLIYARAIALATSDPVGMGVRHLIAALLTMPGPLAIDTAAPGFRADVLPDFLAEVKRISSSGAEPGVWDEILRANEVRLAGYHADTPDGADLLELTRDVEGLAAVIASRDVVPPLSIGLFGDWGSGKSFFMRLLHDRVSELAKVGRTTGKDSAYRGRIAQIEFNAWHYADATLWASLSVHIWSSLEQELRREGHAAALVDTIRRLESEQMKETLLEGARVRAEVRIKAAEKELAEASTRQATLRATIAAALKTKPEELAEAEAEAKKATGLDDLVAIQEEKQKLETLAGKVASWRRTRWPAILVLGAIVAVAAVAFPVLLDGAERWLASLATIAAGVLGALRWIRGHAEKAVVRVDDLVKKIDAAAAAAREETLAEPRQRLEEAKAEQLRLEDERRKLPDVIARLEEEIAKLQNRVDMRSLILQQASEGDYKKYLGLVSTIHRHFSDLARSLQEPDAPIDRIVLYVDDLDRCPPDRVVEVLQAVHLLLSMPLFVVVVAVDSRWLLQSLEDYYARRFQVRPNIDLEKIWGPDQTAAPMHYLEKIFQIPFGLRAPPKGYGTMITRLLAPHVRASASPPGAQQHIDPTTDSGESRPAQPGRVETVAPSPPPSPRSLLLEPVELQCLERMATLVGSPRGAKRLVNLYRIVRAGIEDGELDAFVAEHAEHLQLCLALVVGQPAVATTFFAALFRGEVTDFGGAIALCRRESRDDPRWLALLDRLIALQADPARWASFYDAARTSARFSFEVATGIVPPATSVEAAATGEVMRAVQQIPFVPTPGAIAAAPAADAATSATPGRSRKRASPDRTGTPA